MTYALQAITTKFLGPTDHKGARIVAKCDAGRIIVSWDHALDVAENHAAAARALIKRLGWAPGQGCIGARDGRWHLGATADGYVVVHASSGTRVSL